MDNSQCLDYDSGADGQLLNRPQDRIYVDPSRGGRDHMSHYILGKLEPVEQPDKSSLHSLLLIELESSQYECVGSCQDVLEVFSGWVIQQRRYWLLLQHWTQGSF